MKTIRFAAMALALGAVSIFACADDTNPETPAPDPTPTVTLPPADAAAADADANAPSDVGVTPADCKLVDFCSEVFPVSPSIGLNAVWGSSKSDVWAVGTRGTILHSEGAAFAPITSGTTDIFFAVWGTGPNDVWALDGTSPRHSAGFTGATTTFDAVKGSSWNPQQASTGRVWTGYSTSKTDVWLAGELTARFVKSFGLQNSIWRLGLDADAGPTWNRAPYCTTDQPCTPMVRAMWGDDGGVRAAVGMKGQAFRLDDPDAGHWAYENPQTGDDLESLWGSASTDLWAVGQNGTIRHSTSAGAWTAITSPTASDLHGVWGSSATDIWAVGDAGTVIHFDGENWANATIGLALAGVPTALRGVWGSGPDDVWIVGDGVVLHRTAASRRLP